MIEIINKCDWIIDELNKFSQDLIYLGPIISDERLEAFENQIELTLPLDFKYLLKRYNGFSLDGTEVYGLDTKLKGSSLDSVYISEHSSLMATNMPLNLLPFSPDGFGNHYCLILSQDNKYICPVAFWQHDFNYKSYDDIEICNDSFIDWIKEVMIVWTLGEYNYDGTKK